MAYISTSNLDNIPATPVFSLVGPHYSGKSSYADSMRYRPDIYHFNPSGIQVSRYAEKWFKGINTRQSRRQKPLIDQELISRGFRGDVVQPDESERFRDEYVHMVANAVAWQEAQPGVKVVLSSTPMNEDMLHRWERLYPDIASRMFFIIINFTDEWYITKRALVERGVSRSSVVNARLDDRYAHERVERWEVSGPALLTELRARRNPVIELFTSAVTQFTEAPSGDDLILDKLAEIYPYDIDVPVP